MLLSKKQENDKDNYEMKPQNELDELFSLDNNINSDRIGDFNESENNLLLDENFNNDFGLNNISYDYDDDDISNKEGNTSEESEDIFADLSFLDDKLEQDDFVELDDKHDDMFSELDSLSEKQSDIFEELNFLNEEKIEEVKEFDLQEDAEEKFEEFDFFNENINNNQEKEEFFKGEKMDNEFYELDLLNEKDVIDALNYKIEDYNPINNKEIVSEVKKETISVDGTNVNDLSLLLSKLLSNKTVEITIKIKF
jgi:hypothetical protein